VPGLAQRAALAAHEEALSGLDAGDYDDALPWWPQ
jgi:hypothetical protein